MNRHAPRLNVFHRLDRQISTRYRRSDRQTIVPRPIVGHTHLRGRENPVTDRVGTLQRHTPLTTTLGGFKVDDILQHNHAGLIRLDECAEVQETVGSRIGSILMLVLSRVWLTGWTEEPEIRFRECLHALQSLCMKGNLGEVVAKDVGTEVRVIVGAKAAEARIVRGKCHGPSSNASVELEIGQLWRSAVFERTLHGCSTEECKEMDSPRSSMAAAP